MRSFLIRWAALTFGLWCAAPVVSAQQQRPSPQEAEALLKANPDLAAQIRDRIQNSGMTPDQVRARLRAEGYPENLLDAYLGPANTPDTSAASPAAVAAALRVLNVQGDFADTVAQHGHPDRPWEGATSRVAVKCDTVIAADPKLDSLPLDARGPRARSIKCTAADGAAVAPPDSGRTIFGLDLFANGATQFDANFAGPVDASYRLGPGDQLVLLLTGEVELAHRLDVTREGFIFIPQVGQLHVANLTVQQLNDMLYGVLGRVYPGVRRGADAKTRFSVSVARLRSLQVFVTGDALHPGSYRVSSAGTALTALYAAGGPTPNGSLRRVEIRRGGKLVETLDVYDYIVRGDATHDPRLESGDVVFVPVRGPTVRLIGEVVRPATYEMRPGETLADVVRSAGGFRPTAVPSRVQIERIVPARDRRDGGAARVVLDVNTYATRNANGDSGAGEDTVQVALEDGDVVRVFSIPDRVRNRITVAGNVWQPGSQGFVEHLRLSDAIARAGGVRADTYLGQVLVTRTTPDSTRVQLRAALRADGTAVDDIVLAPDDDIRVFSIPEFRSKRQVAISGAVRKSGRVAYRDGMTLRDLVLLAGGLEDGAYLAEAEIARFPESHAAGATAQMMHVQLDSTYLFATPATAGTPNASQEFVLRPDDQVLILRQPDRLTPRSVVLAGEVKFPGKYTLERRDERLQGLLERAGGLTPIADSAGIVFVRTRDGVGRVGINLPNALRNPKAVDDLVLQDGDSVIIPPYSGIVTVSGSVNAPISLAYVPGADVDFYVRAAGGPSRSGDMSHAYVRQASGKVETVRRRPFWPDAVPKPGPGSKVVVPDKPPSGVSAWVTALPVIASIMGSVVAVVAILHK
jgi:protein involved in polysaccharide export with SLBB domain